MNIFLLFFLIIIIIFLCYYKKILESYATDPNRMPVTPDSPEPCKDPNDPKEICKNFGTCCQDGLEGKNCLCGNPLIKSCMKDYDKCLEGKMYSDENKEYIGVPNLKPTCKNIRDKCCKLITDLKSNDKYIKTPMIKGDPNKILCSVNNTLDTSGKLCKSLCSLNDECNFVIHNTNTEECTLYGGETQEKREIMRGSDESAFFNYIKKKSKKKEKANKREQENFNNSQENFTNYSKFCLNYDDNCGLANQNKDNCLCSHSVVDNCYQNKKKCLSRKIDGVSKSTQKKICNYSFGACCSVIQNIEVSDKFKFDKPIAGHGVNNNLLCNSKDIPLKFESCSQTCLNNPNCDYFETNIKSAPKFAPKEPRYCRLYSGEPKLTPPVFSTPSPLGATTEIEVAKNIYIKKRK